MVIERGPKFLLLAVIESEVGSELLQNEFRVVYFQRHFSLNRGALATDQLIATGVAVYPSDQRCRWSIAQVLLSFGGARIHLGLINAGADVVYARPVQRSFLLVR
jgi:hypothetical protein